MTRPSIDPALGLNLVPERTLSAREASVSVLVPAHDEESTVDSVVVEASRGLKLLGVAGEVVVSASGCTDRTAEVAETAGAQVVHSSAGKGRAITEALDRCTGDIICLIDGDLEYFGEVPLVVELVRPILKGLADACVSDLYWRPLYPQLWLYGFFAPLAGAFYPEMLPKVGTTPWSGQRAAKRELWPAELPGDFTVDLALLLHWNEHAERLRPVVADDWTNPQRPKPDLMVEELQEFLTHARAREHVTKTQEARIWDWYEAVHAEMALYQPEADHPQEFEQAILDFSRRELHSTVLSG